MTGDRPPLQIIAAADSAEWLRDHLGAGPLAGVFHRSGELIHTPREGEDGYLPLTGDDADGPAQIRVLNASILASRITWTYWCYRMVGDPAVPTPAIFPAAAANVACDVPDMVTNLRPLRGVVHSPIVRKDGTILDALGYDQRTRLLHLPEPGLTVPPIPDTPTTAQVSEAVALLDEMVAGFPFVTIHDKANYFGLLLTPLLREIVPPPFKLGAIGAPQPGSGKTLLATILRIVHGGVFRSEMPEDEAETRKQVTAILDVTTGPVVHFDNVSGILRSSVLAGLLTSNQWDDRRLGATEMVSRPNDRLWVLTGNNLMLGGDLVRRSVWVTIDPGIPHPERRTGFAIPLLEEWVRERRGLLLQALLTLIRSWVIAGRPVAASRGSDGYARWVTAVGGMLTYAGVAGIFDHPDAARQTISADDDEWTDFLVAIHKTLGNETWTAKELLDLVDVSETFTSSKPLGLDSLPAELADKVTKAHGRVGVISRSLGMWLANREGRWAGSHAVRKAFADRDGVAHWVVDTAKSAGTAGTAGTKSGPRAEPFPEHNGTQETYSRNGSSDRPEKVPAVPAVPADFWGDKFDPDTVGAEVNP